MLNQQITANFKKQFKKIDGDVKKVSAFMSVVALLVAEAPLESRYHRHSLIGKYQGLEECHLQPDLLLVFKIERGTLVLYAIGKHSELFG